MPRSDTAQDTHNYDYRHIFIKLVLTPNSSTKSSEIESTFRDALFKTLQDLGGITQAIVHFDVISIENISANPNPIGGSDKVEIVCSMGVKLHKELVVPRSLFLWL